eukprot:TRINITY_DN13738_c1_g2_i1.p1 TRINITY_DN13738_c1_g2~~TRINITY_DN13738_c1_g2_i1.p1  ORF type:complete len:1030 (-),score=321.11 TRINITY_DN13738_c1_g2_i1:137-3226(-)
MSEAVRVYIRLRPLDAIEEEAEKGKLFDVPPGRSRLITLLDPLSSGQSEHSFEFSGVLQKVDQQQLYARVAAPIVEDAWRGQSGCIVAYGQTGSGKTYSIFGEGYDADRGLLPRSMENLFETFRRANVQASVSFLELYLDDLRDLGRGAFDVSKNGSREDDFDPFSEQHEHASPPARRFPGGRMHSPAAPKLEIREAAGGRVHVPGLARLPTRNLQEVLRVVDHGLAKRATAHTAQNRHSSRSHTVFTVYVPSRSGSAQDAGSGAHTGCSMSFVDLAGSERTAKSKAEGARFQEAVAINSALTALGRVVLALASERRASDHVPYRSSKLTRILQPSLSGNAQLVLLATVRQTAGDYEETLNTLSFADRCKNVSCSPQVEYFSAQGRQNFRIRDLQQQVIELREALLKVQAAPGIQGKSDMLEATIAQAIAKAAGGSFNNNGQQGGAVDRSQTVPAISTGVEPLVAPGFRGGEAMSRHKTIDVLSSLAGGSKDVSGNANAARAAPADSAKGSSTPHGAPALSHSSSFAAGAQGRDNPAESNQHVSVLLELQRYREKQLEQLHAADRRLEHCRKEQAALAKREEAEKDEQRQLEEKREKLQEQLDVVKAELMAASEAEAKAFALEARELKAAMEARRQEADVGLLRIPSDLRRGRQLRQRKAVEHEDVKRGLEESHAKAMRDLQQQADLRLEDLRIEWDKKLEKKDAELARLEVEFKACREREDRVVDACQEELVSLCDMVSELAQLVTDAEEGRFAMMRQGGRKELLLPESARPVLPSKQTHPHLFEAMEKAEQKVSALERRSQRPMRPHSAERLRHAVAAAAGRYDGVEMLDTPHENGAASSEIGSAAAYPSARGPGVLQPEQDGFFAAATQTQSAVQSVALSSAVGVDLVVAGVTTNQESLRGLAMELRERSLETFNPAAEKEAMRREAEAGLEDESTMRYLKELEKLRDEERALLQETVEKTCQLRKVLEMKKGSLFASSRPGSAARGRSASKQLLTPAETRIGSRASSRPVSRPPTATTQRLRSAN